MNFYFSHVPLFKVCIDYDIYIQVNFNKRLNIEEVTVEITYIKLDISLNSDSNGKLFQAAMPPVCTTSHCEVSLNFGQWLLRNGVHQKYQYYARKIERTKTD